MAIPPYPTGTSPWTHSIWGTESSGRKDMQTSMQLELQHTSIKRLRTEETTEKRSAERCKHAVNFQEITRHSRTTTHRLNVHYWKTHNLACLTAFYSVCERLNTFLPPFLISHQNFCPTGSRNVTHVAFAVFRHLSPSFLNHIIIVLAKLNRFCCLCSECFTFIPRLHVENNPRWKKKLTRSLRFTFISIASAILFDRNSLRKKRRSLTTQVRRCFRGRSRFVLKRSLFQVILCTEYFVFPGPAKTKKNKLHHKEQTKTNNQNLCKNL